MCGVDGDHAEVARLEPAACPALGKLTAAAWKKGKQCSISSLLVLFYKFAGNINNRIIDFIIALQDVRQKVLPLRWFSSRTKLFASTLMLRS